MDIFTNPVLIKNINTILGISLFTFLISFLITPFIGRLAVAVGAIDLPARLRRKTERGYNTRLHTNPYPKLGGLAMFIAMSITGLVLLIFSNNFNNIGNYTGLLLGILIIVVLGFLDDVYEISGSAQLLFQFFLVFIFLFSPMTPSGRHLSPISI